MQLVSFYWLAWYLLIDTATLWVSTEINIGCCLRESILTSIGAPPFPALKNSIFVKDSKSVEHLHLLPSCTWKRSYNSLLMTVQVLSMSRLGGAGAVAPLVTDIPISSVEVIKQLSLVCCALWFHSTHLSVLCALRRKRAAKVEDPSRPGTSGQMMVLNVR